jgi:hypothetical protein
MASILAQSVCDFFLKSFSFILSRLSKRDYADSVRFRFGIDYNHHQVFGKPNTDEAVFPVMLSIVWAYQHWPSENFWGITKINAMLGDIVAPLFLVPEKPHDLTVNTFCQYVKGFYPRYSPWSLAAVVSPMGNGTIVTPKQGANI